MKFLKEFQKDLNCLEVFHNILHLRSFKIDYMTLSIKPNLKDEKNNLENCQEKLDITTLTDLNQILLDIAEIKVNSVNLCKDNGNKTDNNIKIDFNDNDKDNPDKLIITIIRHNKKRHFFVFSY